MSAADVQGVCILLADDDEDDRLLAIDALREAKLAEEDILRTYELGVNSFITKPVSFEGLVQIMRTLRSYWLEIVRLPGE